MMRVMTVMLLLQATAAAQINASVLTAGDYTVYVTGLSQDVTNDDLVEYARHYGEVRGHCHPAHSCRLHAMTYAKCHGMMHMACKDAQCWIHKV